LVGNTEKEIRPTIGKSKKIQINHHNVKPLFNEDELEQQAKLEQPKEDVASKRITLTKPDNTHIEEVDQQEASLNGSASKATPTLDI
jgi:propanediol utilization protein